MASAARTAAAAAAPATAAASSAPAAAADKEADLKIILLGDSAVGKSKLVERYLMDGYEPRQMSTYALTVFRHQHKTEQGDTIDIDFWVTANLCTALATRKRETVGGGSAGTRAHARAQAAETERE